MQITSSPHKISKHCWKFEKSNGYYEGWLRLNNLSLSKIGHFDKLIWVQRLDLSNNKLQSVEGKIMDYDDTTPVSFLKKKRKL